MRTTIRLLLLICGLWLCLASSSTQAAPPAITLADMLLQADALRVGGDYPAALAMYQKVVAQAGAEPSSDDLPLARTALYRMAQTSALDLNYAQAAETWQSFLERYPDDARRPLALLQQANALRQQKNLLAAFVAYQAYRNSAPADDLLAPYVALTLAEGYRDAGQLALAANEYRNVLNAPDPSAASDQGRSGQALLPAMRALTAQRLGDTLVKIGDNAGALQTYDIALQYARTPTTRSQVDVAAAKVLKELGKTDEAIARFRRVLSDATDGDAAPQAVEQLNALAPKDFNYYLAGLAYYDRRQYDTAVKWFHRFLDEQGDLDLAHYYAAKAYEYNSQQDHAIREWTVLIETHPTSSKLAEAWFERADDYHRLGQDAIAIKQYQQLATNYPASPYAEDALFAIAKIYEDANKLAEAAKQYEAIQARNPRSARASEALAAAGLARYRLNDLNGARATLEKLLTNDSNSAAKAKGLFWLGKVLQKLNLPADAKARWQQAFQARPDDYYGMRALDMAQGTMPLGNERKTFTMPTAFVGDQRLMENWLRTWVTLPEADELTPRHRAISLSSLPPELANDPRLKRGKLLLEVGMKPEARAELRDLADQYKDDPLAQHQLSIVLRDLGLYDMVIRAGSRIFSASPDDDLSLAPEFLQRMVYPAPYSQLVIRESQKNNVDPLLLFALVKQESQFDPDVSSLAGARGLGQVMPGTGSQIAGTLKKSAFKSDDLFKPYVSIEFGAYYLGTQYQYFDRDYMMSLAGYNGGPGNALTWKNADVDMAVENIRFAETRTYVRRVYQHYWYYRHLYGE